MALRHQMESPKQAQPGDILIVIHAFEARSPDELSLVKGERIELVEKDDDFGDGWYLGKHTVDGRTGLFPEVYTKLAPPSPQGTNAVRPYRSGSAPNAAPSVPERPLEITVPPPPTVGAAADDSRRHTQSTTSSLPAYPQQYQSTPPPLNPSSAITQRTVSVPVPNFTSPTVSSAPATTQRSISLTMESGRQLEEGSPVLNETLSVIDEHITDMNTPRSSLLPHEVRPFNDSGSDYSGHPGHRLSYINGNETDEDERNAFTEVEVNRWTAGQAAEFLEDIGVERKHCDVFREQEITGEVLLNLDQASLFMKEFDLGVVGRRLRTWHKIKAFQDEVRSASRSSTGKRQQMNQMPSSDTSAAAQYPPSGIPGMRHLRQTSPLSASYIPESAKTSIREPSLPTMPESPNRSTGPMSPGSVHSRKGSNFDVQSKASQSQLNDGFSAAPSPSGHTKKPSFDRNWTMSSSGSPGPTRSSVFGASTRSRGASTVDLETGSDGTRDLDRGYLSGSELDSRKHRNVLRKRDTVVSNHSHSRQSSYKEATTGTTNKRHSRFGSAGSFIASLTSGGKAHDDSAIPHFGSDGKEPVTMIGDSPVVTRLEYDSPRNTVVSRKHESQHADSSRSSLSQSLKAPADASFTRGDEKTSSLSSTLATSPLRNSTGKETSMKSPVRTGSTTETSKSVELEQPKSKTTTPGLTPTSGKRTKNKKQTSAYTRGLLKKTPREAMAECDYSGWMKKKSPSLIATWKPRLFVLRGRRLSYYYTENDTEEQGLIDISNHKVLPADDLLTGIHATVTGAKSSPTSPANAQTETMNDAEVAAQMDSTLKLPSHESIFIFKLVPPRAGLSRAVNFTKPTVHYFAVDNIRQGRLWMAALMKATIQMDSTKPMVTTYGQKTISLAKAQQMKQRPPDLQDVDEGGESNNDDRDEGDDDDTDDTGLKIKGLDMSYEYLASETNGTSGNGEPEIGGGPSTAPLSNRTQYQGNNPNTPGGRATASYQGPQNSLRLVRSLSGGLSHQNHEDEDMIHSELYAERPSRPSTSASRQSQGSYLRGTGTGTPGINHDALNAARTAVAQTE